MVDSTELPDDLVAAAAVGIATDGQKVVVDFELGASENAITASVLLTKLDRCGFALGGSRLLLVVLDNSGPLRKAVLRHFPKARMQRCLVHKEWNMMRYLACRDWAELSDHFVRLRKA